MNLHSCAEWIEDGGPRELNTGQTLVWSNAVFGADKSNGGQSRACIEPKSSIRCVASNFAHTASYGTPFVSGAVPSLFTYDTGVAGSSSSRFILCRHGGEMLSSEELPSTCKGSNMVKLVESTRLSTSRPLAGDIVTKSYMISTSNTVMFHAITSRTSSMMMELEDARLGSGDRKSELHPDQPLDSMTTKKSLFDASLLQEEDFDLVTFQPVSATDTNMTNSLCTQCRGELHAADTSSMSANIEDPTEPENQFIVHNCREDQSHIQASFPLHAPGHSTKESLEADLEDDIQRDIEDEISKEIMHLSQKLANLQARHGAQRLLDGSLPAVLSCPVTPVLTPRVKQRKADGVSRKEDGIANGGCRNKRGHAVAAKVFQGVANRTPEPGASEKVQQSRPNLGQGCAVALNLQKLMRRESLGRRCSSSNSNATTHSCAPSSENGQQGGAQEEHWSHNGDDSLAGTPSSGSVRSNVTDYTHNKPKARTMHVGPGVTSPGVFPDNNRRFEWVKTLRSGSEPGIRGSPGSAGSKQPLKLPTPKKHSSEDSESERKIHLDSATKEREALLEGMTRELETRLNELATRTPESAHLPAVQDKQGTRPLGRVVASRYASGYESRQDKHSEGSIPKDVSEDYGCLDKRTAVHLMKAGLTRGLAGKKQDSYSKSKVAKSEKHGEKLPKTKSIGIQHGDTDPDQPSLDKHISDDQPQQTSPIWSEMKQTFETEYETFVEGPNDGPKISDLLDATKNLQEQAPRERMATTKIDQGTPLEEESSVLSKPKGSALRSKSKRQPIKTTYIRCIEVVVDQSLANRSASAANENLSTPQSRILQSNNVTEGGVLEGSYCPNLDSNHLNPHANHSVISLHEKSVKTRDQPLRTVFKLGKIRREEICVQDKSPGSCDLQVPSCDEEWKTNVPAAEKPLLSSLRERWEELIDALEKERLGLPKIRTETGNVIVSSPRDSGGVNRMTERLKSMEHFSPENMIPDGLQGRSDDPFEDDHGVVSEFIKGCVENEPNCKETDNGITPTQRPLQSDRKATLQVQIKQTRRHWKVPQSTKLHDIHRRSDKSIGNPRKFRTTKSPTPQIDLENFDLESFWCLVRESEDHVQTSHPPSATVR
ncbi:hypothetical protein M758_2G197400 [Ceratodon purpureus]|nr:hypothetical protein M758_2G197400 [Ceratodon purpureus]